MKLLFTLGLVLLVVAQGQCDINTARKEALQKVDNLVAKIKKLVEDTSMEVDKRTENIKIIAQHEKEFGDAIFRETKLELAKTAKSAYMMANLLGSSNDVFRCIEYREREALEEVDREYNSKFLDVGRDFERRAEQYQRDLVKAWKDDYYKAIDQYSNILKKTVSDIQKETREPSIANIVKSFEQTTNQMADIILNIFPGLNKTHIQVLNVFIDLVYKLQQYGRYRVDETGKAIQKCFPKLLSEEEIVF